MATDPQSLFEQAKCLDCFSTPGLVKLAQVGLENTIGQSVQDNGGIPGPSGGVPIPTGLVLSETTGFITATWDALPAGLDGTQIQTSSVGSNGPWSKTFNFVASPGTSMSFAAPLVGQQLCARIRWRQNGVYSAWTAGVCHTYIGQDPQATDWAARVVANGGPLPSQNSITAVSNLIAALKAANIWTKMKHINVVAPDSAIAFKTPMLKTIGTNDPYLGTGGNILSLTVNGASETGGAYLPGINLATDFASQNDIGITTYVTLDSTAGRRMFGHSVVATQNGFLGWYRHATAVTGYCCYDISALQLSVARALGYLSVNRVANNNLRLYRGNSGSGHAQVAQNLNVMATANPSVLFPMWGGYQNNLLESFFDGRMSFFALHLGLSVTESADLYNAVQAMRTAMGGGFV